MSALKGITAPVSGVFQEAVIAADYEPEALEQLKKRKGLQILRMPPVEGTADLGPSHRYVLAGATHSGTGAISRQ